LPKWQRILRRQGERTYIGFFQRLDHANSFVCRHGNANFGS